MANLHMVTIKVTSKIITSDISDSSSESTVVVKEIKHNKQSMISLNMYNTQK